MHPKASSSRRLRHSPAIGRRSTTGARCEARLNALPHFITEIDGLDIHFIHVRSKHENALPVIVTHGWPGSIIEQLKIIDPLTNPTAHGGRASDAFDVVIPSMPGYGYSGKPTTTGWDPDRIARAWVVLMKRLGYTNFVAQGGDWGALITEQMGVQAPPELIGIHTNMPAAVPDDIAKALRPARPPPRVSLPTRRLPTSLVRFSKRPRLRLPDGEPSADALRDRGFSSRPGGVVPRSRRAQPCADRARLCGRIRRPLAGRHSRQRHALLADEHGGVVGRLYWENWGKLGFFAKGVKIPGAVSAFPTSSIQPRGAGQSRRIRNSSTTTGSTKGGHFAAFEQPQLLSEEIRVGFRSLRSNVAKAAA